MLANSSRKTFRKGNGCAAEHEPPPASAALTGCKRVHVSPLRVDVGATHGHPLAVWPEERLCPRGRWRQHFGQGGGLLLGVQSGGLAVCRSCVSPHRGALAPVVAGPILSEKDALDLNFGKMRLIVFENQ